MSKRVKLSVSLVVAVCMAVFLAGAWSTPSEAKAEITLRMAGQSPADHQSTLGMQKVSKWVAEATNGRIDIKTYPSSQLGDYTLVYEELIRGTIDMALISIPSQFDSRLELIYVPYLMRDYGEAAEVFKQGGWLFNKMAELHGELGVLFLVFNVEGFGGLGLTKEPKEILNPLVKKDLLLRVPPMDTFKIGADDMGYTTVSIPYAELYTALQTGIAEGWTGGAPPHSYQGFRDVLKYYYQINNYVETESYLMSKVTWNKLSEADREIIADACARAARESIEISEKEDREYFDKLQDYGVKSFWYTAEDVKDLAAHARKVTWPKLEKRLTKELIDEMMEAYNVK